MFNRVNDFLCKLIVIIFILISYWLYIYIIFKWYGKNYGFILNLSEINWLLVFVNNEFSVIIRRISL